MSPRTLLSLVFPKAVGPPAEEKKTDMEIHAGGSRHDGEEAAQGVEAGMASATSEAIPPSRTDGDAGINQQRQHPGNIPQGRRPSMRVFPKAVASPLAEEKKADGDTNASGSCHGGGEAAQVLGVGMVARTSKKVIAPINGTEVSSPAVEEPAAERKEADEDATPSQPLGHATQGRRPSMKMKGVKVAKKGAEVARTVW